MSPIIIIVAAFVGVAALVGGVAVLLRGDSDEKLEDRLEQLTTGKKGSAAADSVLKAGALEAFQGSDGMLDVLMQRMQRFSLFFEQADTSLTPMKFLAISGAMAVAAAIAILAAGLHWACVPPSAIAASVLPSIWIYFRRKKRLKKFAEQLPNALGLMARALRAGHSLGAGFQLIGTELNDPIAKEFTQVFEEQNLGIPLEEALEGLTDRVPNLDLKFFCTAIILQRQTGGDLAEILDKIGHLIRERFKILGQIQALTGEGRLSGVVLLALPPVLFVTIYYLKPDYASLLFTDPLGQWMMGGAALMQLFGAIVIKKIINIKV